MQLTLNGQSFAPNYGHGYDNFSQGVNQSANFLLGPMNYGSNPGMMMDFTFNMMNQMMMMFMQGMAFSAPPCPCHAGSHLYQPHQDLPFGPPAARPQQHIPYHGGQHQSVAPPPPRPQALARPQFDPRLQGGPRPYNGPKPQAGSRPQAGVGPQHHQQARPSVQAQPKPHPKTQTSDYNPTKDAGALHKAMHGGMMGLGTDEQAIMKALRGKSPEQIEALKSNYKDHYGKDLMTDLNSELGKKDMTQVNALMTGDTAKADARDLQRATSGFTDDEDAVYKTLQGKSKEERQAISDQYQQLTGKSLDSTLKRRLSKNEYAQASGLMEGNDAKAQAAKLKGAMSGLSDDEDAVYKTLEGKSQEEIAAIDREYRALTKKDGKEVGLKDRIGQRFSKLEQDRAGSLLDGNSAEADAAKLRQAVQGIGTDESAIYSTFEGKSKEQRDAILAAYNSKYKEDLSGRLGREMGGNDLQKANTLVSQGKVSDAQTLKYAMEGLGTDEEAVKSALAGKSKQEVAELKQQYYLETGRRLDTDLKSELGGRDEFEATQSLKGRATSVEEALQRANERQAFERKGLGNLLSRGAMDAINDKGQTLDRNTDRANEQYKVYQQAMAEGRMGDARIEKQRLQQLLGYSDIDVSSYQESKDAVADTAGTIAATAAATAVTVATAGAGTPLIAAAVAGAGSGALARTATTAAISGAAYDSQSIASDAAIGAVDGATVVLGAGAGRAAVGSLQAANAAKVARVAAQVGDDGIRLLGHGTQQAARGTSQLTRTVVQGAVDGAVGGTLGGGASEAFRDGTWDNGFSEGIKRVGTGAAIGGAAGIAAGAGTAAAPAAGRAGKRFAGDVADRGRDFARRAGETVGDMGRQAGDAFDDMGRRTGDAFNDFGSRADDFGRKAKDGWDNFQSRTNGNNGAGAGPAADFGPTRGSDLDVLGVKPDASPADIKKAHRRAAMKHHPDRGGDPEMFRKFQSAYERLSDEAQSAYKKTESARGASGRSSRARGSRSSQTGQDWGHYRQEGKKAWNDSKRAWENARHKGQKTWDGFRDEGKRAWDKGKNAWNDGQGARQSSWDNFWGDTKKSWGGFKKSWDGQSKEWGNKFNKGWEGFKKDWNDFSKSWGDSSNTGQSQGSGRTHQQQSGRSRSNSGYGQANTNRTGRAADLELYGLGPDASAQDIKKAHRRAAMKHHPDRGGDAEIFKQYQAAYERLKVNS